MDWIQNKKFKLVKNPNRHYVFRRNNSGNFEINVPKYVNNKIKAQKWLKNNPNKVKQTLFKPTKTFTYSAFTKFYSPPKQKSPKTTFYEYLLKKHPSKIGSPLYNTEMTPKLRELYMQWMKPGNLGLYQNSTANGRTGANLTSVAPNGPIRTTYNLSKGKKSVREGIAKVGAGAQATVYLGFKDKAATKPVSVKIFPFDRTFPQQFQPAFTEFQIGQLLHKVCPRHIPRYESIANKVDVVKLEPKEPQLNRHNQIVVFTEYFHGGDLRSWFDKVSSRINEDLLKDIIRQVLSTLVLIHQSYPKFRHNDLHTGNILVDDTGNRPRVAIGDFGLSVLNSRLGSHEVMRGNYVKNGISSSTPEQYDALLFLIDMRKYTKNYPKLLSFINSVLPPKENLSPNGRLVKAYNGPSTKKMLDMLMGEPMKNAANIAMAALSNVKGVRVSKLTKPKTMTFAKVKGNLTKTKPTNTLAFAKLIKKSPNRYSDVYSLNKLFKTVRGPAKAGRLPKKETSRRTNLKLSKSPGGRIRTDKKLLTGLKRDELVKMANKYGISHSGKTKAQIANALWG
jgi:serine/threonine protein kinase